MPARHPAGEYEKHKENNPDFIGKPWTRQPE